jgi:hypothetical protein
MLYSESLLTLGVVCSVSTNFPGILDLARETFRPAQHNAVPNLRFQVWVDTETQDGIPKSKPYFRGLNHLVYAAYDSSNCMLMDLRAGRALGRFSLPLAMDAAYWKRVVFPVLFGVIGASVGITVLHCACVVRGSGGMLVAGASGSGKSTLALALAHNGFEFLSDDWTYVTAGDSGALAWGLPTPLKLLPDACTFFHELAGLQPAVSMNGELAYEIEPELVFPVRRSFSCDPRCVVFLERKGAPGVRISPMAPVEAAQRFQAFLEDLPVELTRYRAAQNQVVEALVKRPCWLLSYSASPQETARFLTELYAEH